MTWWLFVIRKNASRFEENMQIGSHDHRQIGLVLNQKVIPVNEKAKAYEAEIIPTPDEHSTPPFNEWSPLSTICFWKDNPKIPKPIPLPRLMCDIILAHPASPLRNKHHQSFNPTHQNQSIPRNSPSNLFNHILHLPSQIPAITPKLHTNLTLLLQPYISQQCNPSAPTHPTPPNLPLGFNASPICWHISSPSPSSPCSSH